MFALTQVCINRLDDEDLKSSTKPNLNSETSLAMKAIERYFANLQRYTDPIVNKSYLDKITEEYSVSIGVGHFYEFSDRDLSRIQTLINELRDVVARSTYFDENHKNRLLKRLERLQAELHKKMSDLDRFWGLIGDAGVAFGKFGKDPKPFVDRIRELGEIVWRAQAEAEKLPQDSKMPLLSDQR